MPNIPIVGGADEDLFTNRPPTADQAAILDNITAAMKQCAAILNELPQSRERALAMTNLEQSSMWAKKCAVFRT